MQWNGQHGADLDTTCLLAPGRQHGRRVVSRINRLDSNGNANGVAYQRSGG